MIDIYYIGTSNEVNKAEVKQLLIKYGYEEELKKKLSLSYSNLYSYCTIDIETSGLSATDDEIIEISIVKVRNSKIIDTYSTLIKPSRQLSTNIQKITNISNEVLQYAEDISTILPQAIKFIGNDIIVCHNAKFIMDFLQYNCNNLGIKLENEVIDTITIAYKLFPDLKNRKLSTICERMGLTNITPTGTLHEAYIVMYLYEYSRTKK